MTACAALLLALPATRVAADTVPRDPSPVAQPATPTQPPDLAPLFAGCLGRYSAQMEDAWHAYAPANLAEARRATFQTLLDAVRPGSPLTGPELLHLRLEAKFAQAHLLSQARFHTDPATRRRAQVQAALALRPCDALAL